MNVRKVSDKAMAWGLEFPELDELEKIEVYEGVISEVTGEDGAILFLYDNLPTNESKGCFFERTLKKLNDEDAISVIFVELLPEEYRDEYKDIFQKRLKSVRDLLNVPNTERKGLCSAIKASCSVKPPCHGCE